MLAVKLDLQLILELILKLDGYDHSDYIYKLSHKDRNNLRRDF